ATRPWVARDSFLWWESTVSMLESFISWLLNLFRGMGYPGIIALMAVESSILPLPSELVMPPAGYLAAKGEMSVVLAVACGVLGSVLGALANYGLARWPGRAFLLRRVKCVLILEVLNREAQRYAGRVILLLLPILALITAVYIWWHRRRAGAGTAQRRQE